MRRFVIVTLVLFALIGAFAPLLANDVPLFASIDGAWRSPAIESYWSDPRPPAGALTWKAWSAEITPGGGELAWSTPWPYGPFELLPGEVGRGPEPAHPLGVDDSGRDQLARLIHGAWTAFSVAAASVLLAALIGCLLGAIAGLGGRVADLVVLRTIEVFTCFPALVAVLAGAAFLGGSRGVVILVLAAVQWTAFARIVRGELLSLRERPFVEAARGFGVGPVGLVCRHLGPSLRGPVLVTAAFLASQAIVVESTLTFLGLGTGLHTVSWGAMLQQGKDYAWTGAWHLWLFPALAIAVIVVALHAVLSREREPLSPRVEPQRG